MFSFIKKFFKPTLFEPCEIGDIKAVRQHLVDGADVNAKDWNHRDTPLHYVVGGGHKEVAEFLIAKGADVNAETNDGSTPFALCG